MLVPYRVNTLIMRSPWGNIGILALNILMAIALTAFEISEELLEQIVLMDWSSPVPFFGYLFTHAGFGHLAGNMLLLWVFGNAINGVMHDLDYVLSYLLCGVFAGALHLLVDGHPVVGASGAISGIMGMYLAIYPKNEVECFYWFFRFGTFEIKGYILIIGWLLWDLFSAIRHEPGIACWAHVGGMLAGIGIGLTLLKLQRIHLAEYDNPTALDLLSRSEA